MAQRVLSITLGSEIVKICEASLTGKNKVAVYNAIDLVIPEGLCDDGVILDAQALASTIMQGLQGEGFTAKKIIFSISSKRIASKEAIIPYCKENRIGDIVKVNASEYFPISNLDDYVINYSILEVVQNEALKNYRLSVIATPKDLISAYYELAKLMGMSVADIDYAGNATLQLLKLQAHGEGVVAILQMSSENTVVSIMKGKTLVMQRAVPYGRAVLVDAVASANAVAANVADMMLIEENILDLANSSEDVADAVRSLFSSINRIIEFYSGRSEGHPIEHIYMIGDVISVNGLVDLFNREWTEFEVSLIGHLNGVDIKNIFNISYEIASNYLSNIGALLNPMGIALPDETKQGNKSKDGMPWWILIFAGVAAAVMIGAVLFVYFTGKNEVDSLQARIDALGEVENLEQEYEEKQSELATLEAWYDTTKSPNESLARLVDDLEQVQPAELAITGFNLSEGVMTLTGSTGQKAAVAEFVKQLKGLDYVSDVKMSYVSETTEDYEIKDNFSVSFNLLYKDPNAGDEDTEETLEDDAADDEIEENDSDIIVVEGIESPVEDNGEVAE